MASKSKQDNKYPIIMYLWYAKLNAGSICPYNHNLTYDAGWFRIDDEAPFRDTELTAEAQEMVDNGCTGHFRYHGMRDIPVMECPEDDLD